MVWAGGVILNHGVSHRPGEFLKLRPEPGIANFIEGTIPGETHAVATYVGSDVVLVPGAI
jgi:hypothetical protein